MGSNRVWMRVGDQGNYQEYDSPDEAAQELRDFWAAGDFLCSRQYGIETENYQGHNYVSLFRGDHDAQPTEDGQLPIEDIEEVRRILDT